MHIAFLTPEYPHPRVRSSAGIGTSIKNLIKGIQNKECLQLQEQTKFTVFIYGQQERAGWEEDGVSFHLIPHKKYPFLGFIRYRKFLNSYLNTVIKEEGIQLVEAADWTGITAFMKFEIPVLIRLHGSDTYFCNLEQRPQKKKNFYLERTALMRATAITSVSKFTATETSRLFGLKTPIEIIHNAIDVNFFCPAEMPPKANTILYFGSIIRKKGVLDLAIAFKEVLDERPNATLIFLGKDVIDAKTGVSTKQLIQGVLGESIQKQVSFVSQVPYEVVKKHISEAAVICLPSHAEAFPMTWLEAMAMEKPMVTSNIGWAPEVMIQDETGYMVNPNDTQQLAKTLMHILENPKKARILGKNAREHLITQFNPEDIAQQNIAFYKKLIQA